MLQHYGGEVQAKESHMEKQPKEYSSELLAGYRTTDRRHAIRSPAVGASTL